MTIVKVVEQGASERQKGQIPPKFSYLSTRTTRYDIKEDCNIVTDAQSSMS